jgi:hypothetical protein
MNRFAITLGALTVAVGGLSSLSASAATMAKWSGVNATGACQAALPNYEGGFRKRPLAIANEGTAGAFITCGNTNFGGNSVNAVEVMFTNRTDADGDINCTMVDGAIDASLGFADYYPATITLAAGDSFEQVWSDGYTNVGQAVSCNVPAGWEINRVWTNYNDEIGS